LGTERLTVMWPFIGNERAMAAVQRALAGGSPPHAWLFVGPERVGKGTLARMLAQAVNCERVPGAGAWAQQPDTTAVSDTVDEAHPDDSANEVQVAAPLRGDSIACGECRQCQRIAKGIHSDVQTVVIEMNEDGTQKKEISVDQVREVERSVALKPYEGRTRVVVIDPADAMSAGAQNAFLKTLEEPPPQVVFVLIATREERLLPTVRSRCRRVELGLAPRAEIEGALSARGADSEKAGLLARLARGRPGWVLAMAADASLLEKRRETLAQASALGEMPMADRFDLAERLSGRFKNDRDAVARLIDDWLGWWRDVMLVQAGAEDGVAHVDMVDELREDARRCLSMEVRGFVQALAECREHLEVNVQARIALDALMVQAPRRRNLV